MSDQLTSTARGPLRGIKVVDLTRALAGPWCTQNLADLGAEVIKVERPGTGDESRLWGPPWFVSDDHATQQSAYFITANRNKKSVAIDISKAKGQELIRELVAQADIFVENFKVGSLQKYGLDWAALADVNPSLIYCSITGFGQDGPYAKFPGYDYLFQGLGGVMSVTGEAVGVPGSTPQRVGLPVVDLFTGMYANVAILGALHHRHMSGEGQQIDISLLDCVFAMGSGQLSNYFVDGTVPQRIGNAAPNIMPYGVFPCADGEMIVACANDNQFKSLCSSIERSDLINDPRFLSNALRVQHRSELNDILATSFQTKTGIEWEQILTNAGVPSGPINNYAQAMQHPQVRHRGIRVELPHLYGGAVPGVASPMRFSSSAKVQYRSAPPVLGQHTAEVLRHHLKLDDMSIDALANECVIDGTSLSLERCEDGSDDERP